MSGPASYAVVVLAGGQSRRMGGGDKTALDLGAGQTVLGRLMSDLDPAVPVVVVGPARPLERGVIWTRESPVGGGPVAGLAAAIGALPLDGAEWAIVIAGDQPYAAAGVPLLLAACDPDVDLVLGVDVDGRDQPLLAGYRLDPLRRHLAGLDGPAAGRSVRSLVEAIGAGGPGRVRRVVLPALVTLDVDDPAALSAARAAATPAPSRGAGPSGPPPPR